MQLGNVTDIIANISLAWFSSICLFWAFSLILLSSFSWKSFLFWFGISLVLTSFYFAIIALSTGIMIGYKSSELVSVARAALFVDLVIKTSVTVYCLRQLRRNRSVQLSILGLAR